MSEPASSAVAVQRTVRVLTALCVLLALMGVTLAAMYLRSTRENSCWRAAYEEDQAAPETACGG